MTNNMAVKLTLPTQSKTDEIKKLLTANTDEALAEGSFGLPWYVGELRLSPHLKIKVDLLTRA